jgi:hypothetical protein
MEMILRTAVIFAVLLLGALISAANERQRKAIDGLREQVEAWAEQDIRIKREKLARQVVVNEPLAWLEKTAAAALGSAPKLVTVMPWQKDDMTAIVALCKDGRRLVFTPTPRERLVKALKQKSKSMLAGMDGSLLGDHPQRAPHLELSVVTSGMFFDIEAGQVWQTLCGAVLPAPRLTMYEVAALGSEK